MMPDGFYTATLQITKLNTGRGNNYFKVVRHISFLFKCQNFLHKFKFVLNSCALDFQT